MSTSEKYRKCELQIPKRGGLSQIGKEGRPMQVHVNYFLLKIHGNKKVHHYDVKIGPWNRPNRNSDEPLFRKALLKLSKDYSKIFPPVMAFDGVNNLYTTQELALSGGHDWTAEVEVKDSEGRATKLKFTITLVKTNIDLKGTIDRMLSGDIELSLGLTEVQILNIVLSQSARDSCQVIGGNYFLESSMTERSVDLLGGKSVWCGHFQTVNIGWKPFINVDVSNKPAVKQNHLIAFMNLVLSKLPHYRWDPQNKWDERRCADILQKELKGLKIRYNRPDGQKREWRCNKVMAPARQLKFEIEENNRKKKISVEEYFSLHMKYKLKYPHLPCLHLGSLQKQIYIPVELCELKAQALPTNKMLNEKETEDMVKKTAVKPRDRKAKIEKSLADISNTFQNDKYAQEFGITVESCMSKLSARVYNPPSLTYQDLNTKKAFKFEIPSPGGEWNMKRPTMRGTRPSFLKNKHLNHWAILDLADTYPGAIEKFVGSLYNEGNIIGYNVEFPLVGQFSGDPRNLHQVLQEFRRLCDILKKSSQSDPMILVINLGKNSPIYNALKYEGDVLQKISTQMIQQKNVTNIKPATLHNILLKINSKLGGTNQTLHSSNTPHILAQPVMIMGADVTHAPPNQKGIKPSIAAVVALMDPKASQYECEIRIQDFCQNEEMIHGMEEMTEKLIRAFLNQTWNRGRYKPARIIFYRDGVSEGQFLTVLNIELVAIRRAAARIDPDWQPQITYIVAQKRHKTRLFPVDPRDSVGKSQNVPPGTAVDHTITHPNEFSFFLVSHEGIQGTSKPTKYHLLWDDSPMKPGYHDEMIKMTYYLCHLNARCERSISYPAPIYYAHLAAFRGRVHHDAILQSGEDTQTNRDKLQSQVGRHNYFI